MTKNRIAARKAHEQDNQSDDTEIDDEEDEDEDFEVQSSSSGSDDDEDVDYDSPTDEIEESNTRLQEDNGRKWKKNDISSAMMTQLNTDDLSSDDDEEYNGNTIGRVPLHWYDAYDHIGYTLDGNKLVKRKGPDRVDLTIQNADAKGLKTVFDMYNNREVVLSERDLEIIRRIQMGAFAHPEHDDTPDYSDYFSSIKEVMPLSAAPEPKRRFIPSKWETMRVIKILKAIKEGRYKFSSERKQEEGDADSLVLWNEEVDDVIAESKRYKFHLPAPKMPLPGHAESYNPPQEYLLTEEESKRQEELDPSERPLNFEPKAHSCLRHVAGYENFVKERFERCLVNR
jgi:ribosome biogenesis protein ERB1